MEHNFVFQRSNMDDFPKVFTEETFTSKQDESKSITLKFQEVPFDLHSEMVDFMVKNYLPDEPLSRSIRLVEDATSLETFKMIFRIALKQNLSLVALSEQSEIIGALMFIVESTGDPAPPELPGEVFKKLKSIYFNLKNDEIKKTVNVSQHLQDFGICVHPDYRGWGIGHRLLQVGSELGAHIGVNTIITLFTSICAQAIAEKVGYKVLNEVKFEDFKDENGDVLFSDDQTEYIKLMILNI